MCHVGQRDATSYVRLSVVVPLPGSYGGRCQCVTQTDAPPGDVRVHERQDRSGKAVSTERKFVVDSAQNRAIPQGTGLAVPNSQGASGQCNSVGRLSARL